MRTKFSFKKNTEVQDLSITENTKKAKKYLVHEKEVKKLKQIITTINLCPILVVPLILKKKCTFMTRKRLKYQFCQ